MHVAVSHNNHLKIKWLICFMRILCNNVRISIIIILAIIIVMTQVVSQTITTPQTLKCDARTMISFLFNPFYWSKRYLSMMANKRYEKFILLLFKTMCNLIFELNVTPCDVNSSVCKKKICRAADLIIRQFITHTIMIDTVGREILDFTLNTVKNTHICLIKTWLSNADKDFDWPPSLYH